MTDVIEKSLSSWRAVDHQLLVNGTDDQHTKLNNGHRILVIGCGSVGRCSLPLLRELLIGHLTPRSITVLDCATPSPATLAWLKSANIAFEHKCVEEDSYGDLLSNYLGAGDLLLDLVFNVSTEALVRWCHNKQILYVNSTVDAWFLTSKGGNLFNTHPFELFKWHEELLEMQYQLRQQYGPKAPTAIVEHGANPGLVSHFIKRGLQDMAHHVLHNEMIVDETRRQNVEDALDNKDHARLAHLLGIKTVHISERDSQATHKPRKRNEIANTWCTSSMCEESSYYAEFAWGTHERQMPEGAMVHNQSTHKWPPQRICLPNKGMNVWVRSWVPSGPILGMAIPHPESFSIANYLTVREDNSDKLLYQPSVYFVYLPCDSAVCSLHEWRMQGYPPLTAERIICDDIEFGADELGVLLLGGHEIPAWWTGSVLDIDETRRLVERQSATTLQVAISVVAAVIYALRHPNEGVCFPEQINTDQILTTAIPFLGTWVSRSVNWPVTSGNSNDTTKQSMIGMNGKNKDNDSQWQFSAFRADTLNL
ncbi:unnamed protein product [Rotaria magnacalcarata]|uniref:Homospermidine synthase n=1 Tax=Rotaria magnacalcarata TaxID=392030 RepID=A0A816YFZ3_9BILA|nr:unnamed protein product [Rotaria magnacalcarata]CAF4103838.1 unnamed protein product [Rotaria magnacalcarata]